MRENGAAQSVVYPRWVANAACYVYAYDDLPSCTYEYFKLTEMKWSYLPAFPVLNGKTGDTGGVSFEVVEPG